VVNDDAGNAFTAWQQLGRPASPTARQLDALREAAEPVRSHRALAVADGRVDLRLTLARHEVTLVELDAVQDETPAWVDDSRILGRG
jgi:xylan 1,4-beta-xylosidase